MNVMVWNVEKYGCFSSADHSFVATDFIAQLVHFSSVDVLVVEELRDGGVRELGGLVGWLNCESNARWHFDYLPAGIATAGGDAPAAVPPIAFNDLRFSETSNSEGYGVLFKDGRLQPITDRMSFLADHDARNHHGFIDLCLTAVQPQFDDTQSPPLFPNPAGGPAVPARFPSASTPSGYQPGMAVHFGASPDPYIHAFEWLRSRRPCRVRLNMRTAAGGVVPVNFIVYHAPAQGFAQNESAVACSLLPEIKDNVTFPNVVIAGDFNYTSAQRIEYGFTNFPGFAPGTATANPHPPPNYNYAPTMIGVTADDPPQYVTGSPRDLLYYRLPDFGASTTRVVNPIDLLSGTATNTTNPSPFLSRLFRDLGFCIKASTLIQERMESQTQNLFNWNAELRNLSERLRRVFIEQKIPDSLRKISAKKAVFSLFYRELISDHLPLAIDIK